MNTIILSTVLLFLFELAKSKTVYTYNSGVPVHQIIVPVNHPLQATIGLRHSNLVTVQQPIQNPIPAGYIIIKNEKGTTTTTKKPKKGFFHKLRKAAGKTMEKAGEFLQAPTDDELVHAHTTTTTTTKANSSYPETSIFPASCCNRLVYLPSLLLLSCSIHFIVNLGEYL